MQSATTADVQQIEPLTMGDIFMDAALLPKLIVILLLAAAVAAIVICVRKVMSGPKLAGGSAFISGLRAGGPLLGLIGASWGLMNSAIGTAVMGSRGQTTTLSMVMPGLVECLFIALIGMIAGIVAIVCHWAVEARIDRQVLRA